MQSQNAYACLYPPRQGVMLYGNAWGGLFIVVGRLAMPLLDKLNIVPRFFYITTSTGM